MHESASEPTEADFTKTLTVILLAEYIVVIALRGFGLYCAGIQFVAAEIIAASATWLFLGVVAMNLVSMGSAWLLRKDEKLAAFSRVSLTMTAGQVVLLVASYLSQNALFHWVAAGATFVTLLLTIFHSPGKFLVPTPRQ